MPINRDFIGRSSEPTEPFQVGRELIRHFAVAVGDHNPLYHDVAAAKAAGYTDVVAPPTFLTTLMFRRPNTAMFDPSLGLNYALVVHGEQRFVLHRPVVAGDELVTVSTITEIRDAGRNELMVTETAVSTTAGEAVATAVSTTVSRGTAAPKEA